MEYIYRIIEYTNSNKKIMESDEEIISSKKLIIMTL